MVKNQKITDQYAIYESDVMDITPTIPDNSVDFICFSPPFLGLYNYSSSERDFSNCDSKEQGLDQYEFLVKELYRVLKPGRICAVHCTDLMNKDGSQYDYPHELEEIHKRNGFKRMNKITIWKEPLKVRMRTMVRSLMHKLIVEDSTESFTAMPDYVLIFKKNGENEVPVTHPKGLEYYAGLTPMLPEMTDKYGTWEEITKKYKGWKDPKTNKMSHIIWQRYASSVWDDIRIDNVLKFKEGKDEDDEKHVHPLQLDVIDRLTTLYSNPGEVCFTPFAGVMSEVYGFVSLGRKGIGVELKKSYFNQGVKNLLSVEMRFVADSQMKMF